jgi:hypothetical protein
MWYNTLLSYTDSYVEYSCILRVVDDSILYGSIDAYVVGKGGTKEAHHTTALALISIDS